MRRSRQYPDVPRLAGWLTLLLLLALPTPSVAQPRGGRGYLFDAPTGSLIVRMGASRPQAAGDLFNFVSRQLTVDRADYAGAAFAADLTFALSPRWETMVSFATSSRRIGSEYRDFVDNDDQPIAQETRFRRTPLTAGLRFNLVPAGRRVGRLAWVPTTLVPYVAAGGGLTGYGFSQDGDFIDFRTNDVVPMTLTSGGWATSAFGAAGVSWRMRPTLSLVSELRVDRSTAPLGRDFDGFGRIDLTAVGVTAGLQFHY